MSSIVVNVSNRHIRDVVRKLGICRRNFNEWNKNNSGGGLSETQQEEIRQLRRKERDVRKELELIADRVLLLGDEEVGRDEQ